MRTSKYLYTLLAASALWAAGCKSGQYQKPSTALPEQFVGSAQTDTLTAANIGWEQFYTNPELKELIGQGLQANQDLQVAMARLDELQAYYRQSKAALGPSLQGNAQGGVNRQSKATPFGQFIQQTYIEDYQLGISLSWEIDIWGKLRNGKKASLARFRSSAEGARAVHAAVVAGIGSQYFQLLALDRQLEIARDNIKLREDYVRTVTLLQQAGRVTEVALQQAQAQLIGAQELVPDLERAIRQSENALCILLGRAPGPIARSQKLEAQQLPTTLSVGVPMQLLQYRPDVRAAEFTLMAAAAEVGVAKTSLYPSLTLSGSAGFSSTELSKLITWPTAIAANAFAGLTQPIWAQRKLRTQVEVRKAQLSQQEATFEQTLYKACQEVSDALVGMEKSRKIAELRTSQTELLQKASLSSTELFKSGYATYLEVLQANDGALKAELGVTTARLQELQYMVTLYRALGGGV